MLLCLFLTVSAKEVFSNKFYEFLAECVASE
jgi:hypothetical protein